MYRIGHHWPHWKLVTNRNGLQHPSPTFWCWYKPTTTTARVETTTSERGEITCYDCHGEIEDGVVTKGHENCFTLNDGKDAVGLSAFWPGYC